MKIKTQLLLCLLTCSAGTLNAATVTSDLSVTATVSSTCVVSTSPVAFGTYNPSSASDSVSTGTVTITCTNGTTYTVSLDAGANESSAGNVGTRRMKANTSDYLPYQLYKDEAHTAVWGDAGADILGSQTGNGSAQAISVYGVVLKNQYVSAGSYVDTVVVTITYP